MSGIRDGVIHDFPSKAFLSQSAEKIHRGTLLCCVSENGKLLVAKKFMNNRGGVSGTSVDNFLPYSAEKNS